jgi:hypothetical protein
MLTHDLHYWFDFDFRSKWHLTGASFLTNVGDYIKTLDKTTLSFKTRTLTLEASGISQVQVSSQMLETILRH